MSHFDLFITEKVIIWLQKSWSIVWTTFKENICNFVFKTGFKQHEGEQRMTMFIGSFLLRS